MEVRFAKDWELSKTTKEAADHVNVILQRLASIAPINRQGNYADAILENAINFEQAFSRPSAYYFALNAINNPIIAGEVGRLATAAIVNAATACQRKLPVVLVIDEWQELCTKDLQILLRQARALNIGIVLANQTTSDLIQPDVDLRPVVEGNTAMQAWMKVTDVVGREQLKKLGGQRVEHLYAKTIKPGPDGEIFSYSEQECVQDRLDSNLIADLGCSDDRFILRLTDDSGYAAYGDLPFAARSIYTMSKQEYERRLHSPWPKPTDKTLIVQELERQTGPPERPVGLPRQFATSRLGG